MAILGLLTRPCQILRETEGSVDVYGDASESDATAVATVCELQQVQSFEDASRNVEETQWQIWLPAGTALSGADSVEVDGQRYTLQGDPWPVRNPRTGQEMHVEAAVRRVA